MGDSLQTHVGPVERAATQQHVPDQGLDRRLADQADEEKLLNDLRADGPEGWQAEEKFPESRRLIGVLRPTVLFQRALGLFLQRLDVCHIRQTTGICKASTVITNGCGSIPISMRAPSMNFSKASQTCGRAGSGSSRGF